MKITKPKKQLFNTSTTYYVSSESGGEKHIVVRKDSTYFCDCKDFMTRKLPLYGSTLFSLCKHGGFVRDNSTPASKEPVAPEKQFGIFFYVDGKLRRSEDHPATYTTAQEAQSDANEKPYVEYTVQELGPSKKFAVFAIWSDGSVHRSVDISGVFGNRKAAQFALDEFYLSHNISDMKREVRECQS